MSARIVSPENAPAAPIAWRQAGIAASAANKGPTEAGKQNPPAQEATMQERDWQQELDQKVRAAQQAGYQQGLNDGIAQGTERIQPVLKSLSGMIQDITQLKPKYRHEAEASAVGLSLAVARRILYREIATDPEAILGLVKAAFEKINARETHRLRVSPEDLAVLQQHGPRIGLPSGVELSADPKLARGSAIFETSRGDLDASMDTQLLEIERGFADIIRRRAG